MAVRTQTSWSADDWSDGANHKYARMERGTVETDRAELAVNGLTEITLDVDQLRELSKAAGLIADEIEASK